MENKDTIISIGKIAAQFRRAIESIDWQDYHRLSLRDFPNGACQDVSWLLGKELINSGFAGFRLISAKRKGTTHAWLEKDGLVVDITADQDQFEKRMPPVMVTYDYCWHGLFKKTNEWTADFEEHYERNEPEIFSSLAEALAMIQKELK